MELRGKPLCAMREGFSLHAAQAVGSQNREALEPLLRYGLRAPFSQERLGVREDGKVVYRLRRLAAWSLSPLRIRCATTASSPTAAA